jgi:hypothetical protein
MKYKIVCLLTMLAGICLATAQNSQVHSASPKAGADPLQNATKPLTPKSAMPSPHKSAPLAPNASTGGQKTDAELSRLEHQNIKAPGAKGSTAVPAKSASIKTAGTSAGHGSGINFKYQKPAGGMQADPPGARSANSASSRVTKKD